MSPVGIHDDFFDLGGHSIHAAKLFLSIEKNFGNKYPVSVLYRSPTIEKLASILTGEAGSETWSSFVPIQTKGSKPAFFCVHDLSGDVLGYAELSRNMGKNQPFYGVRARGLNGKERPLTTIEAMAAHYINEIRAFQPEGPYMLGGMCFGGVVAFEMARQLHEQNQEVGLLALFDSPCPPSGLVHRYKFLYERYTRHLRGVSLSLLRHFFRREVSASNSSFIDRVGSLSKIVRMLRVDWRNQKAMRKYHPGIYKGKMIVFMVDQPLFKESRKARMKWKEHATEGVDFHTITATHHSLLREPQVKILAEKLEEYIDTV